MQKLKSSIVGLICLTGLYLPHVYSETTQKTQDNNQTIGKFDREQALAYSQSVIGTQVGDYPFTNTQGRPALLSQYRGKPLVISLIYTSCFHICPTTTRQLGKVVDKARDVLGADSFHVLTIGFDTINDTADAMRIFAQQQAIERDDWDFLSTDAESIQTLSNNLGFLYFPTPHGFDHLVQSTLIDASGKVYRQIYGMYINTPHFIEPLKELVFGTPPNDSLFSQISSKIRLFCTVYDPANDRYRFDYSLFVGLATGLIVGSLFLFWIMKEWRKFKHKPH